MIQKIIRSIRYDWSLHFILLFTNWLPDNVFFLRLRGFLVQPFFKKCGKDLRLGRNLKFYNPQNIILGDFVYISHGVIFLAVGEIHIGNEVMFGPYVVLSAGNHQKMGQSYRFADVEVLDIYIDNGVWMGASVSILGDAQIGAGSVIGSNAVVTAGKYPAESFLGGVPAKQIK